MNADGTHVVRLTVEGSPEYQPEWSPDGSRIAFVRVPSIETPDEIVTAPRIFTMNPDGSDVRQVSSGDGGSDFSPSWSASSSQLVFAAIRYEDWGIWVVDADGANEHLVLGSAMAGHVEDPEWSPDGRLIAFIGNLEVDDYSPRYGLYVMRPDGTHVTRLAASDRLVVAGDVAWQPVSIPSESPAPTGSSRSGVLQPRVTGTIEVGAFPRAVAVGDGSVWATVDIADGGSDDHQLVRIDPATGRIVSTITVFEAGDVAVGHGDVWVTSRVGDDGAVLRVDLSTGQVVASVMIGDHPSDLAVDDEAVWATTNTTMSGFETSGKVVRIDPATNAVVARVTINGGWPRDVVVGEGSVWVYGHSDYTTARGWQASSLWQIDPTTNQLVATVLDDRGFLGDGGYFPDNVAVGEGWVWAADESGDGVRIDPGTAALTTFQPTDEGLAPNGFAWPYAVYAGHVFFGLGSIEVLDTETLEVVASIPLESQVADAALDPDTGTLWIANYEGTVTRIDLR